MNASKTVFVGLSGGVDSGVAAARLLLQGYSVVGVFIKVWHPDFMVCNWEAERLDAMRVAAHLKIPFLTCDAEADYRDAVAKYFINEYRAGRTPNPDVMCNKYVKFGAFLRFAKERGADFIATGHYAQKIETDGGCRLARGIDSGKDQSYFLWTLSSDQLAQSLFPVGDTTKENIRKEAESYGLPVFKKKDSQGICFLGHIDIPEFLSHYIDMVPGKVLDTAGEVVGEHTGAVSYTIGQRHGFEMHNSTESSAPQYVARKDVVANTITVSREQPRTIKNSALELTSITLRERVHENERLLVQTRYRQVPFWVNIATGARSGEA